MTMIESRSPRLIPPKGLFADFEEPNSSSPQPGTKKRPRIETVEVEQTLKVHDAPNSCYQLCTIEGLKSDSPRKAAFIYFKNGFMFENLRRHSDHTSSLLHWTKRLEHISCKGLQRTSGNTPAIYKPILATRKQIDNPGSHHLIAIYYYQRSSVHELDIAVPREKVIYGYIYDNKLHIKYGDGCFAEFLKEKLEDISERKERGLCLKIAELCSGGKIRGMICNRYDGGMFIEVEVGTRTDWAKNHRRPYQEGRNVLGKDFGDGIVVRLCEGQYVF